MQVARLSLIVAIGVALLAGGTLPPEHLHLSRTTTPQVIHSHLAFAAGDGAGTGHHHGANVDGDDHHQAVDIQACIAAGPRPISLDHAALAAASALALEPQVVAASVPSPEPDETASPPAPRSAPRAPPA